MLKSHELLGFMSPALAAAGILAVLIVPPLAAWGLFYLIGHQAFHGEPVLGWLRLLSIPYLRRFQKLRVEGLEHFHALQGKPFIILLPHFVALDVAGCWLSLHVNGVSIYSNQKNAYLNQLLIQKRIRFGKQRIYSRQQGLRPIGESNWDETVDSGTAVATAPGTSGVGLVQAGALEESNVDMAEELVKMRAAVRQAMEDGALGVSSSLSVSASATRCWCRCSTRAFWRIPISTSTT